MNLSPPCPAPFLSFELGATIISCYSLMGRATGVWRTWRMEVVVSRSVRRSRSWRRSWLAYQRCSNVSESSVQSLETALCSFKHLQLEQCFEIVYYSFTFSIKLYDIHYYIEVLHLYWNSLRKRGGGGVVIDIKRCHGKDHKYQQQRILLE